MEKLQRTLAILNLAGELEAELQSFFTSRNIQVSNESSGSGDWTHILTRGVSDFTSLNKAYDLTRKERNIISLSQVPDLQNFTVNNGNLIVDNTWFKGPMGPFILDKYFQSYGGIALGDNYPAFNEIGSFNIANPFNTGEYLDRLIQKAFENGTDALTIKTYFDHLIMYVTGLKTKGKAGLPFEVTYGSFENIFAVQVHFFSKQLTVMDVATSLSSSISKKAEEYYLNVAVQSADFFDFSYMPQVNKVVVTALWTKDERIRFENRGLMFSSLVGGLPLATYQNEGSAASMIVPGIAIKDFGERVTIPESLPQAVTASLVKGFTDGDEAVLVKGTRDPKEEAQLVEGFVPAGDDVLSLISDLEKTEDEVQLIKGGGLLEEIAKTVKNKFDQDKNVVKVLGDKIDIEKVVISITSKIDESTKEKNLMVRSLTQQLPESIKTGLYDFAKGLRKDVESLSDNDLDRFQLQEVPEILKRELLAAILKQKALDAEGLKQMESKLATVSMENEKLKSKLKALNSEVRILKESRNKLAEIQMKAREATFEIHDKTDDDDALRKQFQQKLNEQKVLNDIELKKLSALLERETKLIADLRQEEIKSRRLQLESQKKDAFFAQELEKVEREVKAKELVLIKMKETFTKSAEKKDKEIRDLRSKVEQFSKAAVNGSATTQTQAFKDLEKQNLHLSKQVEVYKNKMAAMSSNLNPSKSEESFKDEARKLQMINQQMKNQLDAAKKEVDKHQSKASADNAQMTQLRIEKMKLEDQLRKAHAEVKMASAAPAQSTQNDAELKRLQAHNQILEGQVKEFASKVTNLEAKLAEASKPVKAASGDDTAKVKLNQIENSMKKLTQDLTESKNQLTEAKKETNKLRQEKTALQNQIEKLKKDADKAKAAPPKKTSGKAA